jgi:hypothetical protein
MIGRCSKCKEPCEIYHKEGGYLLIKPEWVNYTADWLSNCCGAPLIEDGERSHDE